MPGGTSVPGPAPVPPSAAQATQPLPQRTVPASDGSGKPRGRFAKFMHAVSWHIDAIPLSTKLVSIMLALMVFTLCGIAIATQQLVWNDLLSRTDAQLTTQVQTIVANSSQLQKNVEQGWPNDYFLEFRNAEGDVISELLPSAQDGQYMVPDLPGPGSLGDFTLGEARTVPAKVIDVSQIKQNEPQQQDQTQVQGLPGMHEAAQAVSGEAAPWRVIAYRWNSSVDNTSGTLFIGMSLSNAMDTSRAVARYFLFIGVGILILVTLLGSVAISHTLKPLKRIEKTAAKIAAGDLSQRIETLPENTEIGSLSASLNSMLGRIERSFRKQEETTAKMKRFVSDASHELRTPLAAIHGYAELYRMQRDMPGALERADESIKHIEDSSARMTVLVEDLLSLARLDEGRGINLNQTMRLDTVISDAAEDLHALDPSRTIQLGSVSLGNGEYLDVTGAPRATTGVEFVPGELPEINLTGDSSRIRQVLTNIIGNIHRYTPDDSPVQLSLTELPMSLPPEVLASLPSTKEGLRTVLEAAGMAQSMSAGGRRYAFVQIVDHGPGVSEQSMGMLFERFYTADPSRARLKGGTGLGLAIVKSVVNAHHGFIAASATDGGGLTFSIMLPLDPAPAPASDGTADQGGASRGKAPRNVAKGKDGRKGWGRR